MKKFYLFCLALAAGITLCSTAVLLYIWQNVQNTIPKPYSQSIIPNNQEENSPENIKNTDVDSSFVEVKEYLLQSENETVYLICRYSDGNEIKSPIDNINIKYLTDDDRNLLEKGITLPDRESAYKLIEDYCS